MPGEHSARGVAHDPRDHAHEHVLRASLNAVWGMMRHFGGATHRDTRPGDVFAEIGPIELPE